MGMAPRSQTFWLFRRGNEPSQCQDACAADDSTGRYAVADGASEGCFSRLWATILVRDFVQNGSAPDQWYGSLAKAQAQWDADVQGRVLRRSAERGVRQGAFATFLGIVLGNSPWPPAAPQSTEERQEVTADSPLPHAEKGQRVMAAPYHWQAVAVGDTCLMHTRAGVLLRAFPLQSPLQFNNDPHLVGSRMSAENVHRRQTLWADGLGQRGDRLWAMTDALAQCCLTVQENGGNPWSELESLLAEPDAEAKFVARIEALRDSRQLKNDDVTLLAIKL